MSRSTDAKILSGALGIDGQSTQEPKDAAADEQNRAIEDMRRGQSFLGREFLTWLLWRSDQGGALSDLDDQGIELLFVGRVILKGLSGSATELSAKGQLSAYSEVVKNAIHRGLLVHSGRLRITHGEAIYELSLDAEHFSFSSVDIPKLLTEDDDDPLAERLSLCLRLGELVDALWATFMDHRAHSAKWKAEVDAIRAWAEDLSA